MKIKRIKLTPSVPGCKYPKDTLWRIQVIHKHEVVVDYLARNTGLRVGPNLRGWEYGPENGPKKLAFSLREVERAAMAEVILGTALQALEQVEKEK